MRVSQKNHFWALKNLWEKITSGARFVWPRRNPRNSSRHESIVYQCVCVCVRRPDSFDELASLALRAIVIARGCCCRCYRWLRSGFYCSFIFIVWSLIRLDRFDSLLLAPPPPSAIHFSRVMVGTEFRAVLKSLLICGFEFLSYYRF